MSDVAVIIVAAGKSTRFNDKKDKKPFVSVNARALWLHSVDRFIHAMMLNSSFSSLQRMINRFLMSDFERKPQF